MVFDSVNIPQLVSKALEDKQHRMIILVDETVSRGLAVYGKFVHRYDQAQQEPVDSYFDRTYSVLSTAPESVVYTSNTLPILGYVGKAQVVMVTRRQSGYIEVTDAGSQDISSYLGVGG